MRTLLLLLLTACSCYGQAFTLRDPAFVGQKAAAAGTPPFNPTSISGNIGWWCVSSNYTTNSGVPTLADLSGHTYDLTNSAGNAGVYPIRSIGAVNGLDVIGSAPIHGSAWWLASGQFTSAVPLTVCMVISISNNISGAVNPIDGNVSTSGEHLFWQWYGDGGNNYLGGSAFGNLGGGFRSTNKWSVVTMLWNGASSVFYTNNTAMGTVDVGTSVQNGLTLNATGGSHAFPAFMEFAEMSAYNAVLSGTDQNTLFNYYTNKYAIVP